MFPNNQQNTSFSTCWPKLTENWNHRGTTTKQQQQTMKEKRLRAHLKVQMVPLFTTHPHMNSHENSEQAGLKRFKVPAQVHCVPVFPTQNSAQTALDLWDGYWKSRKAGSPSPIHSTPKMLPLEREYSTRLFTCTSAENYCFILTSPGQRVVLIRYVDFKKWTINRRWMNSLLFIQLSIYKNIMLWMPKLKLQRKIHKHCSEQALFLP